jgi:hypothetical protein
MRHINGCFWIVLGLCVVALLRPLMWAFRHIQPHAMNYLEGGN